MVALILALFVGISLGLIGSGGSILSVPILVYILHIEPVLATTYSLFIVGSTAFLGGFQKVKQRLVDFDKVLLFGFPTVIAVFVMRYFLIPKIPNNIELSQNVRLSKSVLILTIFAIVMLFASFKMITRQLPIADSNHERVTYFKIMLQGVVIGMIAGFVGAGGGFLIVPALILLTKTPIKIAIGTSLFIVALQSTVGFLADYRLFSTLQWPLLLGFTFFSVVGLFIGNQLSKKINGEKLKTGFGYFVLLMAVYILIKEVFFLNIS